MSALDRYKKAQALINELEGMQTVSFGNYKQELSEYRRIFLDLLVLVRDQNLETASSSPLGLSLTKET